ncbi:acyl transferase domain-containing protein [Nocardia tenerifensis]|uniref:Acyl transferase domain-containing protein n=1 Tax=Nocardia tenerifensis TaxID=228006 RepID=A0A318KAT6_9NOCA|nr:type I polyketide synthase [Nocardia tenerifensis]PXX71236.1 acyl transferase domain-containing protein [Nocardia tenerifensis]
MDTNPEGPGSIDRSAIEEWVAAKISQIIGVDPAAIDRTTTFAAYGLTSADAVGLSGELEEWLDRSLPETLLYEHPTVELLSAALVGPPADSGRAAPQFDAAAAPGATAALDASTPAAPDDQTIVIAGLACRFPGGANTPQLFWRNLADGIDTATDVPPQRWDAQRYFDPDPYSPETTYTTKGAFVDDLAGFDAQFFGISPREALRMDPQQRMLLETVWAAFEDAAIPADQIRGSRTGVFVGMMADSRYAGVLVDHGGHAELDDPYLGLGSASSVAAGRLSYLLDLRGPSLVVDTACSSSLVALHLAVNSIRNGECDRAVVAGVSAIVHPDTYQQACKMRMLAADGRCKTFDAAADGFLLGEGCGAVVVERLTDAVARRHQVLAVVHGTAVNQDGTSNGLTAPNRAAQVAVVREAQQRAGIGPDDIDYVEAHGSGTQLGDAIEIAALTEAFGEARAETRPLYVGAVKTNIGHLTGAAGMAGLVKTVLALNRRTIPRNLHLRQPNPAIDWAASPVRLPHENIPWPLDESRTPTAGVSSFGWSGTNAHVIVSAPPRDAQERRADDENRWHILPLSGRSPETVTATAHAIAEHLRAHPRLAPSAVAATLQTGRSTMPVRAAVPFRTLLDAAEALDEVGRRIPVTTAPRGRRPDVRFVLPGTGDQFPGMGRDLYRAHPEFRAAIDRCAEIAADALGMDLRTALYPAAAPAASDPFAALRRDATAGAGELVSRIDLAHAVVFTLNYAAARLWRGYGIEPNGLLGYSLGEYSAACLAGVFDVEVALPLVVRRAQLVAAAEAGAMLTVAATEARVAEYLGPDLSCAAINSPTTVVVAGTEAAVAALEQRLTADEIAARRVPTTRAMHSPLLDPLREKFLELFAGLELRAPRIPFVSNLTGTWITDEQARDPQYWADHMCSTVAFADGVDALAGSHGCVVLDLGAGQLGSLVSQNLAHTGGVAALPTLRGSATRDPDEKIVARTLGRLWAGGVAVDWAPVGSADTTISLPAYSFQHQQFWPEAGKPAGVKATRVVAEATELYEPHWAAVPAAIDSTDRRGPYLVFTDPGTRSADLAGHLVKALDGAEVVTVAPGTDFGTCPAGGYRIRPGRPADYERLVSALAERNLLPRTVVHLWSVHGSTADPATADLVAAHRRLGYDSLMALAGPLGRHCVDGCRILVVTDHAQAVEPEDELFPGKTTVAGPALTIGQEYPGLAVRTLDVVTPVDDEDVSWDDLTEAVVAELNWPGTDVAIARRGRRRLVKRFRPLTVDAPAPYVRDGGVYVITGGTGNIGLEVAAHLAAAANGVKLALLARTPLPDPDDADALARADETTRAKAAAVRELTRTGAEVLVLPCDIGDDEAAARAFAKARNAFGPIDGVVHAAGVLSPDAFTTIEATTPEISAAHFRAKIDGTIALADALRGERPDFVVLLSSMSAVLGGIGFAAYAAANAFQDQFVTLPGLPGRSAWRSACWDTWRATVRHGEKPGVAESLGKYSFSAADALAALDRLVAGGPRRAVVSAGLLSERIGAWVGGGDPLSETPGAATDSSATPPGRTVEEYRRRLTELWCDALGVDRVGPHENFFESGGNSLVGLQLINAIKKQFRVTVATVALFEAPTIADMADYLLTATADERNSPA